MPAMPRPAHTAGAARGWALRSPSVTARESVLVSLLTLASLASPACQAGSLAETLDLPAGVVLEGEARLQLTDRSPNTQGPLAAANQLQPGTTANTPASAWAGTELRGRWKALAANVLLSHEQWTDGRHSTRAQVNELQASADLDAWQFSAGRKVVSWDVGYAFRPNDLVQQEARRQLLTTTPMGRPLLQAEVFSAEQAASLVWANPRLERADARQTGGDESALAARLYSRQGALDAYAFGRAGQRTGGSLGLALAWVATDETELHLSARWLQRHEGWQLGGAAQTPRSIPSTNPWATTLQGHTAQWLLGGTWTGNHQQSLLVEAWHDGSAPSDALWRSWQARSEGLLQLGNNLGLPAEAQAGVAGNLAWQTSPMAAPSIRQDNLFLRLAWQPEPWQFNLDALIQPTDKGHSLTASLQWQGDQWRINASWRQFGGPSSSVLAQLPQRHTALLSATVSF